ncbi:MAG: flavin reductase family protein [Chloroflexi bacterium]|nr:flavin reductase family protein [Chloroflexota bacterium]
MLQEAALDRAYRATPQGLYLITTSRDGKPNLQFAFRSLGVIQTPPYFVFGQQTGNYSYETVKLTGELVINTCSQAHIHAIRASQNLTGRDEEDKFAVLGITPLPAKLVKAPLVKDSYASVECRLVKELDVVKGLAILLLEGIACYYDPEHPPIFRLDGKNYPMMDPLPE